MPQGSQRLSVTCPENEFASWSRRPGAPKLVEAVIQKIEEAAAELLEADGSIKRGCVGRVEAREKENRIKLHWNNWFDVSFQVLFLSCCDCTLLFNYMIVQYFILGERFQLYLNCVWCFMHMATIGLFAQHICNSIITKSTPLCATMRWSRVPQEMGSRST